MKTIPGKFYFFRGWGDVILSLPDPKQQVAVFEAVSRFLFLGEDTCLKGAAGEVWAAIKEDERFKSQIP